MNHPHTVIHFQDPHYYFLLFVVLRKDFDKKLPVSPARSTGYVHLNQTIYLNFFDNGALVHVKLLIDRKYCFQDLTHL